MARRRNTNEMEDELRLVVNEETLETTSSSSTSPSSSTKITLSEVEDSETGPQIEEESHHVPFPLSFKQRLRHVSQSSRNRQVCQYTTVGILGVMCILAVSVPLGIWSGENKQECHDFEDVAEEDYDPFPYLFWPGSGVFALCERGDLRLAGTLGIYHDHLGTPKVDLYDYTHGTRLNLTKINTNCLRVEWDGTSSIDAPLRDCYDMGDSYWYAGYELYNQTWPISNNDHDMMPFYPGDYLFSNGDDLFGPVVHPLWLNSNGTGIIVDEGVQLYVGIKDNKLCLQALPFELECIPHSSNQTFFHYTVCVFDTIAETAKYFLNESGFIKHPTGSPDIAVFRDPIWSTWAEYKTDIDDSILQQFIADIRSHDFSISQLEIDDGYSANYGELSFNHAKFDESNVRALSNGVPLTAWVHPFVNPSAVDEFNTGLGNASFLPGYSDITRGHSASLVEWWNGFGGVIDFLNSNTSSCHQDRLNSFMITYNLTSLKFDAGEITYMPKCVYIEGLTHPAEFTAAYARFVANQSYASRAEVRIGYFTQDLPILVRMLDKDSTWGIDNGLKSVLTTALTFGIAGYPFILPDMVGGNFHPDRELYVRWAQLTAFLPTMQFSIPPWKFDNEIVTCVRNMVQLHNELSTIMYNLSSDATRYGFPIIRPLWWTIKGTDDEDEELWTIDDQFLIGDDIMVAPVLDQGATTRSVYFPNSGAKWQTELPERWKDEQHDGRTRKTFENIGLCDTFYFRRM